MFCCPPPCQVSWEAKPACLAEPSLQLYCSAACTPPLCLPQWSPPSFPKASEASEGVTVCSENHLVGPGDSLIPQIQAGPISHSLVRVPEADSRAERILQDQKPGEGPGPGGSEKQRQSGGQSWEDGRCREIHRVWGGGVQAVSASTQPHSTTPPLPAAGEVAMVAGAREMSQGQWWRREKGLVDCKLSIMAQIISILRRALCTMPRNPIR